MTDASAWSVPHTRHEVIDQVDTLWTLYRDEFTGECHRRPDNWRDLLSEYAEIFTVADLSRFIAVAMSRYEPSTLTEWEPCWVFIAFIARCEAVKCRRLGLGPGLVDEMEVR